MEKIHMSMESVDSKYESAIRWKRSKSIEDVQHHIVRSYVSSSGIPRREFPDPHQSRILTWFNACLRSLGRGRTDHALLFLHKNNWFRRTMKRAAKSKTFAAFFSIIALLNAFTLCFHTPAVWSDYREENIIIAHVSVIYLVAYIVEAFVRIIAYGFIFHPKAYLRSAANIGDLFIILFALLYEILTLAGAYSVADIFGALMALKLVRVLAYFKRVNLILRALAMSVLPLLYVSVLTLVVMVFFTFLGMELRLGCDLHSGCFADYIDSSGRVQSFLSSGFPCLQGSAYSLGEHQCPAPSRCVNWPSGPNYGFTSFDNFLLGLLTVFQLITLEGWSAVFYLYESACGILPTWPYFIIAISLGSVIFLNLWLGVLTSVFIGVSERQETQTTIRKVKAKKKNDKDLENYRKWIRRSLEMELPSEAGSIGRRPSLSPATPWLAVKAEYDSEDEDYLEAQFDLQRKFSTSDELRESQQTTTWLRPKRWVNISRKGTLTVIQSQLYFFLVQLLLITNLILLMSLHYPYDRQLDTAIFALNYVFSGVYILKGLLELFALGPFRFITSSFHRFDTVLNLLNLADLLLIPVLGRFHISAMINAWRCFMLIKIMKYTRYWNSMRQMIETVSQVLTMIVSLMALVLLFLFVYTIIGMRLFGERLDVDSHVELPNFDNFLSSFLLVFQLITTEDWQSVYYTSNRPWLRMEHISDIIIPIYFTTAVIVGGFILLSIFLSIAVDKLSEVKSVEEEEGREVEQKDKERKDRKRHINALKHSEGSTFIRKTLKRTLRPIQGVSTADTNQKREWEREFLSSPVKHQGSIRDSIISGIQFTAEHHSPARSGRTPRLFNPLRFAIRSDDSKLQLQKIEEKEEADRKSGGSQEGRIVTKKKKLTGNIAISGGSAVEQRGSAELKGSTEFRGSSEDRGSSEHRRSSKDRESVRPHSLSGSELDRKASTVSSPDFFSPTDFAMRRPSFERTQSTPEPNIGFPRPAGDNVTLEAITEHSAACLEGEEKKEVEKEKEKEEKDSDECTVNPAPSCPLSSTVTASNTPATTEREATVRRMMESSLEDINAPIPLDGNRRGQGEWDKIGNAKFQWKKNALRMWNWFRDYIGTIQFDPSTELAEIPNHSAFFILSPDNSFRVFCYKLVCSKAFRVVTYVTIFLASILLTLEIPVTTGLSKGSIFCLIQDVIIYVDSVIVVYFLIEMALKMVALGVILHRGSYFRGFFNITDFVITVTTLIPIVTFISGSRHHHPRECLAYSYQEELVPVFLASMRVFRVLRPVRAVRIGGLYHVLSGLLSSIKSLGIVLLFDVLAMSIFAVIGTILFRGSFFYCTDPNKLTERECRGHYFTYPTGDLACPQLNERRWLRHGLNFDNFGQSLLTLFAMITSEGWQDVMYNAFNAKLFQEGNSPVGPEPYSSPASFIYFLLYMCIMALVLFNVFIGTVIVTFQEVGIKAYRESKLDRNQRNCLYYALTAKPVFRYVPKFSWQQRLCDFIFHPAFQVFLFFCLLLNSILLSLQSIKTLTLPIYWTNFIFTVLFSVEAMLKIIALHPVNYFRKIWNFFEFLTITGAILEFILQNSLTNFMNSDFHYGHFVSTFRVLWLLRFIPQVRLIMWTIVKSLEIFPWVGLILLVVVYLFAAMGMQIFGTVYIAPIEASVESPGVHITQYNNFANFPQALLLMTRVTTGEDWPDVMLSCKSGSLCASSTISHNHTCGSDITYVFFPFYYFVASILFLNLFVAIIIDNFDYLVRDRSILGAHQLSVFVKLWSIYDPSASGVLSPEEVIKLMKQCNPPVGWGRLCPQSVAYRNMIKMNMPLEDGKVTFNSTLFGLVKAALNIDCSGCCNCREVCNVQLKEKLRKLLPTIPNKILDEVLAEGDVETVRCVFAARLIQSRWRAFINRRKRTLQLFEGTKKRILKAGPRRLPDAGPALLERTVSDFEFERFPAVPSIASLHGSKLSLERTLTPNSAVSGSNYGDGHVDGRSGSKEPQPLSPLSQYTFTKAEVHSMSAEEADPFEEHHEDGKSELSFASAFTSPTHSTQSLSSLHYTETTV